MADTRVLPISSVYYGLKAETSFGVGIDVSGDDGTNYLTQPVVQAQKPTFNIQRESRLLSGRGSVKNVDFILLANFPEPAWMWIIRNPFKNNAGGTRQ